MICQLGKCMDTSNISFSLYIRDKSGITKSYPIILFLRYHFMLIYIGLNL